MALCPFARQRLIPESHTQGRITPRVLIFHQAVSSADSLYGYWTSPGVELESHFYAYKDGSLDQYVDTEVRADANVEANGFAISVETWDNGGSDDGWTPEQLATLTRLAAWACETHGIPAVVPSGPYGSGIGWHNLYPTEWAAGPRRCPGTQRIAQVRVHIIPRVAAGNVLQEDLLSALSDDEQREVLAGIRDIRKDLSIPYINSNKSDSTGRVVDRLRVMLPAVDNDGIRKAGGVAPGTLTNAIASTYRYVFEQLDKRLDALAKAQGTPVTGDQVRQWIHEAVQDHVRITGTVEIGSPPVEQAPAA